MLSERVLWCARIEPKQVIILGHWLISEIWQEDVFWFNVGPRFPWGFDFLL